MHSRSLALRFSGLFLSCFIAGCGSQPPAPPPPLTGGSTTDQASDIQAYEEAVSADAEEQKPIILRSVLKLLRDAATNPSGENFNIATDNLNDYFRDKTPAAFALEPEIQTYLQNQRMPASLYDEVIRTKFVPRTDGRHIEDCLLYSSIAMRNAGDGEDLERVQRIFEWVTRQVQLVPSGRLAAPNGLHAQVRPFDALLRGMAVESGVWCERSWLFMTLCRQLGLDSALLCYRPPARGPLKRTLDALAQEVVPWVSAVLIDGKVYLFDCRIGRPIPRADGRGVATLTEVLTDPQLLANLNLPGASYPETQKELARSKWTVLIESNPNGIAPRMKLLQEALAGENRMVLYRDPTAVARAFQEAIGPACDQVDLWDLPLEVQYRLFNDGAFVQATQFTLQIFESRWPLLSARMMHLLGDLQASLQKYVSFRYAEGAVQTDGKTAIPGEVQRVLDLFSTYYLGLAQLDRGEKDQAAFLFKETLRLLPEPGRGRPFYCMFRWGAAANLGKLHAAKGENALAIRYLTMPNPTTEAHGLRLLARELIWEDPFTPPADTPTIPKAPDQLPALPGMALGAGTR
jgi:hypothetical protein